MAEQVQLFDSSYQQSLLQGLDLFRDVEPDEVFALLQQCQRRDVAAGDMLLEPGTRNEHVFVVLSGALHVRVGNQDAPILATMRMGSCAGEMSIIEDTEPSAYVVAAEPSHLLVIHKDQLWELVNTSHAFSRNLLLMLSDRVRSHNNFIAENLGALQRYERNALTDALTGLGNRHAMEETFPAEVGRCQKKGNPVSLVMIDVDNFKLFNDRFGHVAGDRALGAIARILRKHFRTRDILVRFGGDEFAVLLPGVNRDEALEIAGRVLVAVNGDHAENEDSLIRIPLEVSMGVAELDDGGSFDKLLRAADRALYRAKEAGRNRVCD